MTELDLTPMPEKGWSVLTVRERAATRIKGMAKARELTVDGLINQLIEGSSTRPSPGGEWSTCETCGSKVKTKNLQEHTNDVRPGKLTVKTWSLS